MFENLKRQKKTKNVNIYNYQKNPKKSKNSFSWKNSGLGVSSDDKGNGIKKWLSYC